MVGIARVVLALCVDVRKTGLYRRQLIVAHAPIDDLFSTGRGVEVPLAIHLHEREREWPVVRADLKHLGPILRFDQRV